MFVALRDIRFARGRFALMAGVVALISGLVLFLYGLTGGLAADASSAVTGLPAQRLVFGAPPGAKPEVSFTNSGIGTEQEQAWQAAAGPGNVSPLGVSMTRLSTSGAATSVSVIGTTPNLLPPIRTGAPAGPGQVVVGAKLAEQHHLGVGAQVGVGAATLTVSGVADDRAYGHAPTVWTTQATWQQLSGARQPSALAVTRTPTGTPVPALDRAHNTHTVTRAAATAGIDGYSAEQGSLSMIQGFLFAISALVVGAFFTVWTVQRKPDIAVLKAVGASSAYLIRDALAQALLLLVGGALLGAAAGAAGGAALAAAGTPFTLDAATVAVPFAAMVGLGLVGAALAVRRIVSVDPLTALGATR